MTTTSTSVPAPSPAGDDRPGPLLEHLDGLLPGGVEGTWVWPGSQYIEVTVRGGRVDVEATDLPASAVAALLRALTPPTD